MGAVVVPPHAGDCKETPTVLVVEDDPALQDLFCTTLEAAGYTTVSAGNTIDAFALLAGQPTDVAILDVDLPDASGLDVLDHLAAAFPDTVVVMATGNSDTGIVGEASARGADSFLVKPISPRQLAAAVGAALARRGACDPTAGGQVSQRMIACLVRIASARDRETGHHSGRMSRFCAVLADELGFRQQDVLRLQLASVLHDIGKVALPDHVLHKPGPLTPEEWTLVRTHPQVGWTVLAGFEDETLHLAAEIARDHHERWDGSGYPRGLSGTAIPLEARIAAVADVFDALTSDRPYRSSMSLDEARAVIAEGRGVHFDPPVVDVFLGSAAIDRISPTAGHAAAAIEAAAV